MQFMSDRELIYEKLLQVSVALGRIDRRFSEISSPADFYETERGEDLLDAIGMMFVAIGENLKWLDRVTDGKIFEGYPEVNWRGAKGMRDVLAHRYFDIDAEEVFTICDRRLPGLRRAVEGLLREYRDR